jgi:hypothetical protein
MPLKSVDALGLIGQLLDLMVPQRVTKPKEPARRDAYVEYTERVDIELTTVARGQQLRRVFINRGLDVRHHRLLTSPSPA